jgi:hypothetical protein
LLARLRARFFPRREHDVTLVVTPTRVELACRVAPQEMVASPVSGARGALVQWTLLSDGPDTSTAHRWQRVLARGAYGFRVLLESEDQLIEVPLASAELELREDPEDAILLDRFPRELRPHIARFPYHAADYRETMLFPGDRVRLVATLERVPREHGYRAPAAEPVDLRALPGEPIIITEL